MRKILVFFSVVMIWTAGFSQTLSFKFGTRFKRADLDVRWEAPSNAIPDHVKVYKLAPNKFKSEGVAELISLGGFSEKQRTKNERDWLVYNTADSSKRLGVLYSLGSLEYEIRDSHSVSNLTQGLPTDGEALLSVTNWLAKLGIDLGEIERKEHSNEPDLHFFDSETEYFVNHNSITNIEFRGVRFRRALDGYPIVANGVGGDCEFRFGDHGKLIKISMSWRAIHEDHVATTVNRTKIVSWIREGRAIQNMIRMDAEPIDWATVKSVRVKTARLCYYGGIPAEPSDFLIPFVALWTTVDRGHGTIDVEIDSPVVENVRNERK